MAEGSFGSILKAVQEIKNNPAFFREQFPERRINNIYLDTPNLLFYEENLAGAANRLKVRIRWYASTFGEVHDPFLELKMKTGNVGSKKRFQLPAFFLTKENLLSVVKDIESKSGTSIFHEIMRGMQPVFLSTYQRKYFIDQSGHFRLTLDYGINFFSVTNSMLIEVPGRTVSNEIILELKNDLARDDGAEMISSRLPFSLSKSSKYMLGVNEAF